MSDVFLSYKREERTEVERLASALRRLGLQVWFDASLAAGDTFSDEIDREARSAKAIVVCWSPGAATSQWVKAEAQIGFTKQNLISTYVAGPNEFEPPLPFSSLHVEDLRAWAQHPSGRDRAWLSILRKLGKLTGRPDITAWGEVPLDYPATAAREWLEAFGAELVNDVNALRAPGAIAAVAATRAGACLMHMQGEPRSMQQAPHYEDVLAEVHAALAARIEACGAAGIERDRLLVDPGIGFGKSLEHNLQLLAGLDRFADLGCPLLLGVSRKSLFGKLLGLPVQERLIPSVVAAALAIRQGAAIIRAHDVAATAQAVRTAYAIGQSRRENSTP